MRFIRNVAPMLFALLFAVSINSFGQSVLLTGDAQINSAATSTNYGANTSLTVNSSNSVFLQFNLVDILPAGITSAEVTRARLILFPDKVTTAGNINVYGVTSAWDEGTLTYANKPTVSASSSGTGAAKAALKPIFVPVTQLVQSWVTNSSSNRGFEVKASGTTNFTLDSKENTATSHQAVLQIDLIGPAGATGAAGATGPAGPKGATGATGPKGPAGTVTLPYSGSAISSGIVFNVNNFGTGPGLQAGGGEATTDNTSAGDGVTGYGGEAAGDPNTGTYGGTGVAGFGGVAQGGSDLGGYGGFFQGGSGGVHGGQAGAGLSALGGYGGGYGIYATSGVGGSIAGYFAGDVTVAGNLSKSSGSFKIDHPLDPENKYLVHSFVESPDMMNVYNGNVVTDGSGEAVVTLPDWFEALNRDFRYQLTAMGQFAQAMVASEIANGKFVIRTDKGNVKVSWQVTGIRQDAWANAHRLPIEVQKTEKERGHYIHPELFGHKGEPSVADIVQPQAAARAAAAASQKQ